MKNLPLEFQILLSFLILLSFSSVVILFYSFFKAIFIRHKRAFIICSICTIIAVIFCVVLWNETNNHVIRMKEDVLYILPSSLK
jgi:hypothetical protein